MHQPEHRLHHSPIAEIYVSLSLYGVGMAMVGIFIPIYLLSIGYSISQALLYMLFTQLSLALVCPVAAWLADRVGLQRSTLVRIPFFLFSFLSLYFLESYPSLFVPSALAGGAALALFWVPVQILFLHRSASGSRGKQTGLYKSVPRLFQILAPAAGGLIAAMAGFDALLLVGLSVVALSTVPLFFSFQEVSRTRFSLSDLFVVRDHRLLSVFISDGFLYVALSVLFPLWIFVSLSSTQSVGFIVSLGSFFYMVGSFLVGRRLDAADQWRWFFWAALAYALGVAVRPLFSSAPALSAIIVFGAVINSVYDPVKDVLFYNAAARQGGDGFVVVREMIVNFSRALLLGLAIILPWTWGFFLAGAAMVVTASVVRFSR